MKTQTLNLSKTMSYFLRHAPQELGITLNEEGYVSLELFVHNLQKSKPTTTLDEVRDIVNLDEKTRYSICFFDGLEMIRANQGHSTETVSLDFPESTPPDILYHGTTEEKMKSIESSQGLNKMNRHHVYLSSNLETTKNVARRWREESPVVLIIDAKLMVKEGHKFYLSQNNVWLVEHVPIKYISQLKENV